MGDNVMVKRCKDEGSRIRWIVLLAAFLTQMSLSGVTYCAGIYYIILRENLGGSSALMSLAFSLNSACFFFIGPLAGMLTDVYGPRPVALVGSLLGTISMLMNAFVTQPWQLVFTFGICTGSTLGIVFMPSMTIVNDHFPKRLSMAMGMLGAGFAVGAIITPPVIIYFNHLYGWRGAILIMTGIFMQTIIFSALFRPIKTKAKDVASNKDQSNTKTLIIDGIKIDTISEQKTAVILRTNLKVFRNWGFLCFFVVNILFSFGLSVINVHLGAYAISVGNSEKVAVAVYLTMGITSTVSRLIYGFLGQHVFKTTKLYTFAILCCGLSTICYPFFPGAGVVYIIACAGLIGCFQGSFGSIGPIVCIDLTSVDQFSSAFGYILVACGIGFSLGGPTAGWLYDSTLYYPASFYLGGGVVVLAAMFMVLVWINLYCSNRKLISECSTKVIVQK